MFWRAPDLAARARSPCELLAGMAGRRGSHSTGWVRRSAYDGSGEASGVQVAAVCGPNVALDLDGPSQQINKRRIEFAAELGVATFMTKGPGREGRNGTDAELDQMAAAYEDLAAYGADLGVAVTFHPHINHLVNSTAEWKPLHGSVLDGMPPLYGHVPRRALGLRPSPSRARLCRADRVCASARFQRMGRPWSWAKVPCATTRHLWRRYRKPDMLAGITVCPGEAERPETEKMQINRQYLHSIGY